MIDIRGVHHALLVSEYLSIRRAAAQLGLRPSAVSRRLQSLEVSVGFTLFHRSHVGAQPTIAGTQFLERARRALAELEDAAFSAGRIQAGYAGTLHIAFHPSIASGRLRRLFEEHRARFPELQFRFQEGASINQLIALRRHQVDVAFLTDVDEASGAHSEALWDEKIYVALPEQHRLAASSALARGQLRDETFVIQADASGLLLSAWLANKLHPGGVGPNFHTHDISREGLLGLVGAGYGLTIVAESATALAVPGIVYRPVLEREATMSVRMAWLDGNENPALGRFLSHARRVARRYR